MRDWTEYLRRLLDLPKMRGHHDERIVNELADHLEEVYRTETRRGATEEEAEARALAELGDPRAAAADLVRAEPGRFRAVANRWSESREEQMRAKGGLWEGFADVIRDCRYALRALARRPLFSSTIVVILSVGIGATTAIYTLVDAVLLSPLPFDQSHRLVNINHTAVGLGIQDAGQCAAWHFTYEEENHVFQDIGMYFAGASTVLHEGVPTLLPDLGVTSGVLRALRVQPVLGRVMTTADEEVGAPNVVLLGYGYWQNHYAGRTTVLGQTLQRDGQSFEIVGVLPATLRSLGVDPAIIYPMRFDKSQLYVGNIGMGGVARLRDGVKVDQANSDVARMLPLAFEKFPGGPIEDFSGRAQLAPDLGPLKDSLVGSTADILWLVMAGVGVVLVIACANVANLLLVRAQGKETEMALRAALGASGSRLGWEYLKESLLLGLLGGAGGFALAFLGIDLLVSSAPQGIPRLNEVTVDLTVLLFTASVSIGVGLICGAVPGLKNRGADLIEALRRGGRQNTGRGGRNDAQKTLAVTQVALALVLMVVAGLMLRTFTALRSVNPGFDTEGSVITFRLLISQNDEPSLETVAETHQRIAYRLAAINGVTSVSLANDLPMDGFFNVNPLYVDGLAATPDQPPPLRRQKWIAADYAETLRIPIVAGRTISRQDVSDRAPVALVSRSLAVALWGSPEAAIGRGVAGRPDPPRWANVIGVVADVREDGMRSDGTLQVYWPQVMLGFFGGTASNVPFTWRAMSYAVRSERVGAPGFVDEVQRGVWDIAPYLPIRNLRPLDDLVKQSMATTSYTFLLLIVAAGVAVMLGAVGVYGVISHGVSRRTPELGMRMALGARRRAVTGMVMKQGFLLTTFGLSAGLVVSVAITRLMSEVLYGVSPLDPITLVCASVGLLIVTLAATYLPARAAARVDPMTALRAE